RPRRAARLRVPRRERPRHVRCTASRHRPRDAARPSSRRMPIVLQTEATMNDDAPARRNDPASVLPSQWTDLLRAAASPERRLMAAVMIDAIRDHRAGIGARSGRARQLGHLAAHWIASTETTWPFSFENICAAFDVDAADLRRRLQRERATGA